MTEKITIAQLQGLKKTGEKIVSLTAYDASFARILDAAGVEITLVGDSLGMVVHGEADTLAVSIEDMTYHSRIVSRVCQRSLVVVDMPYRSYESGPAAYANAYKLVETGGAEVVKLEGGVEQAEIVAYLVDRGIPVCGHIGLQPQSVKQYGGYKVQGRTAEQAERIMTGARDLEASGACMVVLECIPAALAQQISNELTIPTIGIGAGVNCDGQVLVVYDVLGLATRLPHMAKNFLIKTGNVRDAVKEYVRAVKTGAFPGREHSFK